MCKGYEEVSQIKQDGHVFEEIRKFKYLSTLVTGTNEIIEELKNCHRQFMLWFTTHR